MDKAYWAQLEALLGPLEKSVAILGNLGQAITAVVAGVALGFAWAQIRSGKSAQREATLRELNRDQNRLSFENPEFAWPELMKDVAHKHQTVEGDKTRYKKYHQFIIIGLIVCERALLDGRTNEWSKAVDAFLRTHAPFLDHAAADFWEDFDNRLIRRWEMVRNEKSTKATLAAVRRAEELIPEAPQKDRSVSEQIFSVVVTPQSTGQPDMNSSSITFKTKA